MRPKALKANRTLTPFETAELVLLLLLLLEEPLEAGELEGELGVDLEDSPELGGEVEDGTEEVRVTPTARHISTAASMDFSRSAPEQLFSKQVVVPLTKFWSWHKQAVSWELHEELVEVKQGRAQSA